MAFNANTPSLPPILLSDEYDAEMLFVVTESIQRESSLFVFPIDTNVISLIISGTLISNLLRAFGGQYGDEQTYFFTFILSLQSRSFHLHGAALPVVEHGMTYAQSPS